MDSVRVDWLFATALFERETIQALADRLLHLDARRGGGPETDIWQLPLEAGTDQAALAAELADLPPDYPSRDTLLCHIERRAIQLPDALAVSDGVQSLTYGELEVRANRLAHWLQSCGITPGAAIGIQARRDVAFVIALLACWKAGAAYVPSTLPIPPSGWPISWAMPPSAWCWAACRIRGLARRWRARRPNITICTSLRWTRCQPARPHCLRDAAMLAQIITPPAAPACPRVMVEQGSQVNLMADHGERIALWEGAPCSTACPLSFDAGNMTSLLPSTAARPCTSASRARGVISAAIARGCQPMIAHGAVGKTYCPGGTRFPQGHRFGGEACPSSLVERWGAGGAVQHVRPDRVHRHRACARLTPGRPSQSVDPSTT